tara:strand:- start:32 stop:337 length:306 start_codon:yes stop_codon:yes gene_type:complete
MAKRKTRTSALAAGARLIDNKRYEKVRFVCDLAETAAQFRSHVPVSCQSKSHGPRSAKRLANPYAFFFAIVAEVVEIVFSIGEAMKFRYTVGHVRLYTSHS